MIYMEERHLAIVLEILAKYDHTFYAYGSRVKGTQKKFSDLDLVFMEEISWLERSNIDEDFEESDLPFKVEVSNYRTMSENFKNIIKKDLEILKISTHHDVIQENP